MANIVIEKEQAIELLNRAVEEKGADYVYPRGGLGENSGDDKVCAYERNGAPSCIVGHVFSYLGVPVETLAVLDQQSLSAVTDLTRSVPTWIDDEEVHGVPKGEVPLSVLAGIQIDPDALGILRRAQADQDGGIPWGKAVQYAIAEPYDYS